MLSTSYKAPQSEKFRPVKIMGLPPAIQPALMRINALGSLYYFVKVVLKRSRLTEAFHRPLCEHFERQHIKDVVEIPRDHFKSTICTEGLSMWWALPICDQDLDIFSKLGYSDEFCIWMKYIHDPDIRILLVSENITNAAKLGSKVRWHYESNDIYRTLFPETLPTPKETWTSFSLQVNRPNTSGASHGEGTFDFLGVGGALQSRHYKKVIQDDLVGRRAIESPSIMDKTIEYHRLVIGAFESEDKNHENDEIVIGNRWAYTDLNSWIREEETWWRFSSHSALGGCCSSHPSDTPIFPEEFSMDKLLKIKKRLGSYLFSCQYLNNPASPEDADFKEEWLNYYGTIQDAVGRTLILHDVKDGHIRKDMLVGHLTLCMASDPAHAGNAGARRCRHSIVVVGLSEAGDNYLLDCWAQTTSYDTYISKLYEMADKWHLNKMGLETIAAQRYLKYHLDYRNKIENRRLKIEELKGEVEAPDGGLTRNKEWRIRNVLQPIFERGNFWIQRKHQDFLGEYTTFPKGKFVDILDALAYTPQMLRHPMTSQKFLDWRAANRRQVSRLNQPYSYAAPQNRPTLVN